MPLDIPRLLVLNKADLLGGGTIVHAGTPLTSVPSIQVSAKIVWQAAVDGRLAQNHLTQTQGMLPSAELFAEEPRLAQRALNEITGGFTPDGLLGEIFSRFYIGK